MRALGGVLLEQVAVLNGRIAALDRELAVQARQDRDARRLMSIPGVGPVTAMALLALAPPLAGFRRGRDLSAWLGRISEMGQRDLRRLLVCGAMSVIENAVRHSGTVRDP